MAFKFIVLAAFVAVANGLAIPAATSHAYSSQSTISHGPALQLAHAPVLHTYAAPIQTYAPIHKTLIAEPQAPAHYDFEYSVHDPHTGDIKSQKESRQGDVVHGSYSLVEPDGSKRIVEYTADHHNGFNAVVHREPSQHPTHVKTLVAAPAVHLTHAAPALHLTHAAPALSYGHVQPALSYGHAQSALSYGHVQSALSYGHAQPSYVLHH